MSLQEELLAAYRQAHKVHTEAIQSHIQINWVSDHVPLEETLLYADIRDIEEEWAHVITAIWMIEHELDILLNRPKRKE